jgi:hypothetical protein
MFKIFRKELDWNGTPLVLETGKVARQADGAVMVSLGETTVLCTAVAAHSPKPGQDFFPLTVNYQEKAFAAGKIPGGFFKREGRPTEKETLVSRLIDRPIRPLFVKGFKCETQPSRLPDGAPPTLHNAASHRGSWRVANRVKLCLTRQAFHVIEGALEKDMETVGSHTTDVCSHLA